jgi:hypothetical protein
MLSAFGIMSWKDIVEILFFSSLIYAFSRWLIADKTKRLLPYFYLYLTTILCAQYAELHTIALLLLVTAPGAVALFVLMHQHTLQKNLIALKNIATLSKESSSDWIVHIGQFVLQQLNHNKEIICIIERSDNLESFITCPFIFNAPLSPALLQCMVQSPSYEAQDMLWISRDGTIRGINSQWHDSATTTVSHLYDATVAHTTHTDALFFHATPQQHTCIIIRNGLVEKNSTITRLQSILRQHMALSKPITRGGTHDYRQNSASNNPIQKNSP